MSSFIPALQCGPSKIEQRNIRDRITALMAERSAALHAGKTSDAWWCTVAIAEQQAALGEHSPVFPTTIEQGGRFLFLSFIDVAGNAHYAADPELASHMDQEGRYADAVEQRWERPLDRLGREQKVNAAVRGFGHADDLMGRMLFGPRYQSVVDQLLEEEGA